MPQFDLYENPSLQSREWAPYVVDLQHDMLQSLSTRIMAPLLKVQPQDEAMMKRLNPVISFNGNAYFLSAAEMASVPVSEFQAAIGNLKTHRDDLMAAVDLVFTAV